MEGLPLPARVLDVFFDTADWLGPDAQVEGTLTLRQTGAKDWEADFQGDLLDVDLGVLVGRRFPGQRLSGLARVALKSARWADRPGQGFGWVEAQGELTSGQGTIGIGLLRALASEMKFRFAPKLARLDDRKPDHRLPRPGLHLRDDPRRRDPDRRRARQRVRPRRRPRQRRRARWPTPPRARPTSAA